MICSFDYKGIAEIIVKKSVPEYESILKSGDEAKKELLKSCVAVQTAILLIPNIKKEHVKVRQTTHAKVEYFDASYFDTLMDNLRLRLQMLFDELNGVEYTALPFVSLSNSKKRFYGAGFDV